MKNQNWFATNDNIAVRFLSHNARWFRGVVQTADAPADGMQRLIIRVDDPEKQGKPVFERWYIPGSTDGHLLHTSEGAKARGQDTFAGAVFSELLSKTQWELFDGE